MMAISTNDRHFMEVAPGGVALPRTDDAVEHPVEFLHVSASLRAVFAASRNGELREPQLLKKGCYPGATLMWFDRTDVTEYTFPHVVKLRAQHQDLVKYACCVDTRMACSTNVCSMPISNCSAGLEIAPCMNCGFTPVRAIKAATLRTVEPRNVGDRLETLVAGKRPDMIVREKIATANVTTPGIPGNTLALTTKGSRLAVSGRARVADKTGECRDCAWRRFQRLMGSGSFRQGMQSHVILKRLIRTARGEFEFGTRGERDAGPEATDRNPGSCWTRRRDCHEP